MLAVASMFWTTHGYTPYPVQWDWDTASCAQPAQFMQSNGCADGHSNVIHLDRSSWDRNTNVDKCKTVIHEMGHAAFGFDHVAGTIMDPMMENEPTPGACLVFRPRISIGTALFITSGRVTKP
jgi:hypothetical protein